MKEHPISRAPAGCLSSGRLTLFSEADISNDLSLIKSTGWSSPSLSREIQRALNSNVANGVGRMNFLPTRSESALLGQPVHSGCDSEE